MIYGERFMRTATQSSSEVQPNRFVSGGKSQTQAVSWLFPRQGEWQYEHWLHFPKDGWKYEIINGVLHMSPPPSTRHQDVAGEFYVLLRLYVRQHSLGKVLDAPCGVRLPNQPIPIEPDILFVRHDRLSIIGQNYVEGAPDFAVEVLSPSNSEYDLTTKRNLYEQAGIVEYWVVSPWAETISIYRMIDGSYAEPILLQRGMQASSTVINGFSIQVDQLFDLQ
jgi:Uma2 family endonuclease